MKKPTLAYIALALVCVLWGTTYLAIRIGVEYVPGFMMAGIRNTLAGLLTAGFFVLRGSPLPKGKLLQVLTVRSFLMVLMGNCTVHWAEQYISSGIAAIIAAIVPLWMVIDTLLLFKGTRVSRRAIIGLLIGFVGILAIFYDHLADYSDPGYTWGIVVMLLASISWSLGSVYSSFNRIDINPVFAAGIQMLMAGVASIGISLVIGEPVNVLNMPTEGILAILYLAIFGSMIAYNAYLYALAHLTPTQVSIYAYINPIVAVLLGWIVLNEQFTWTIAIAMSVTLGGVYLVNTAKEDGH